MTVIIILAAIALFLVLLYVMPIEIRTKTIRKNDDDVIVVRVKTLYGIVNLKFEVPYLDIILFRGKPSLAYQAEIESNRTNKLLKKISKIFTEDDLKNIKRYFHRNPVLLRKLKNYWSEKLRISKFSFVLKYGITDAALAAAIYGVAWTVLGTLLAIMKNNLNFTTEDIVITPYFDREMFNVEFSCIINFRLGDIINTGIMVLKERIRLKRSKHTADKAVKC